MIEYKWKKGEKKQSKNGGRRERCKKCRTGRRNRGRWQKRKKEKEGRKTNVLGQKTYKKRGK